MTLTILRVSLAILISGRSALSSVKLGCQGRPCLESDAVSTGDRTQAPVRRFLWLQHSGASDRVSGYAIGSGAIVRITHGMSRDSENSEVDFRPAEAS
jgi:hypothetical protein